MTTETMPPCQLHIAAETLSAWRDDLLETRRADQIRQHLRTCLACQQQMREFDHIAALLRRQRQLDPGTQVWQGVLGRLEQRGGVPAQRSEWRNGLIIRPDFRQERRHPMKVISRTGQRWSARAVTLVAALLLVALVGGLTLGLLLGHRAAIGTPNPPSQHIGAIHEFALPPTCAGSCHPLGITSGPDGTLWFIEGDGNKIGRITPAGRITEFALPTTCGSANGCAPEGITRGPDGTLWFTESLGDKIGRITPAGRITEFALPTCGVKPCDPFEITSGPDGNLWFTEANGNKIGRITPAGQIQAFALPTTTCSAPSTPFGCGPFGITSGPDGTLWFTGAGGGNTVGRMTLSGSVQEFTLPSTCGGDCQAYGITSGPDGNLWFTEYFGNAIGRITPAGHIEEFALPTTCGAACDPTSITSGPDGNLWFTEYGGNRIGRITPAGQIQEFALPTTCGGRGCSPDGITLGPDGHLWFTDRGANAIGEVAP